MQTQTSSITEIQWTALSPKWYKDTILLSTKEVEGNLWLHGQLLTFCRKRLEKGSGRLRWLNRASSNRQLIIQRALRSSWFTCPAWGEGVSLLSNHCPFTFPLLPPPSVTCVCSSPYWEIWISLSARFATEAILMTKRYCQEGIFLTRLRKEISSSTLQLLNDTQSKTFKFGVDANKIWDGTEKRILESW